MLPLSPPVIIFPALQKTTGDSELRIGIHRCNLQIFYLLAFVFLLDGRGVW
jgi:hypothetical protein